ncbi:helix-turn-helix domain-containing protein [soil metagenome]
MTDDEVLELDDPRAMRALAHPLRLRLLGMLRVQGPATASILAERVDEAPSLISYHLRKLGEHGFVTEAPDESSDGRERWWRSTHVRTRWSSAKPSDDPQRRIASTLLDREIHARYAAALDEWLVERDAWAVEWHDAAFTSDWNLRLSATDLTALRQELFAVVERYATMPEQRDDQPAGHQQVAVQLHGIPRVTRD